jgi:hypothetical protein
MLLLDHESLPRIKPHLHLYIYNIHNLQFPVKYNSIVFAPRMMYIRDLSRSYKGNSRLLDKQRLFFIHLSLLPANKLEIAGLQSVFASKTTHLCTNINFQGVTVKRFSKKLFSKFGQKKL